MMEGSRKGSLERRGLEEGNSNKKEINRQVSPQQRRGGGRGLENNAKGQYHM